MEESESNVEKLMEMTKRLAEKLDKQVGITEERVDEAEKFLDEFFEKQEKLLRRNIKKKKKRISIRLCEEDLLELKERAIEERMPYQTLVARLVSKYLRDELEMKGV